VFPNDRPPARAFADIIDKLSLNGITLIGLIPIIPGIGGQVKIHDRLKKSRKLQANCW